MKNTLTLLFVILDIFAFKAQSTGGVGIGTTNPTHTLEIIGNLKMSGDLYLENPGNYSGSSVDSYLLVKDNSDNIVKRYVPATAQFTAINSTVYFLTNINPAGVTDFNTGVSATNYYLAIGGFIVRGENDNPVVSLTQPGNTNQYIPQYSARSFIQNGIWHIRFTPNNNRVFNLRLEIRLSVSIYRRDMLTTVNTPIVYNMNAVTTGVGNAPIPVLP